MTVSVLAGGLCSTVQDLGRVGYGAIGVGRAGALDQDALCLANSLVGNAPGAAGMEITLAGPRLKFETGAAFALCGAPFDIRLDGRSLEAWRSHRAFAGSVLEFTQARSGARAWLALAGGIDLPCVLGSRSTDLNAGLGPLPRTLNPGDRLPLGAPSDRLKENAPRWSLDPRPWFATADASPLRLLPGRDLPQLEQRSLDVLCRQPFRISATSNRVALRLDGDPLQFRHSLECVSEPLVEGVVQLPPDGRPMILLGEHPVSGGYPCIGIIAAVDHARLAQARPGAAVRFTLISAAEAHRLREERQRARNELMAHIRRRLEQA